MAVQRSVRLRRWSLALGTSFVAMGIASSAQAQCAPDPTVAGGTTTCTGTDADGLSVNTRDTRVVVATGAVVNAGAAAAAITSTGASVRVSVNGIVDGAGKTGILVTGDPSYVARCPDDPYAGASVPYPFCPPGSFQTVYPSSSATIEVAAGASVTGTQALLLRRNPANIGGSITASLVNAGTLTGTAGAAIVVDTGSSFNTVSISNLATGTIAGIRGPVEQLANAGRVNASGGTAIATSAQRAVVANTGRITAAGGTAIDASGALALTNSGTITGAVIARGGSSLSGSTIDTLAGTIAGDLTLGTGDDTLLARYDNGRLVTGVTGTIDGGAGVDTLRTRIAGNATLGAVALPTGFERLGLTTTTGGTVTLDSTFGAVGGLVQVEGGGTVINNGTLSGTAAIVANDSYSSEGSVAFVNAGTITATGGASDSYAVSLIQARRFQNDGDVTSATGGVSLNSGAFVNNRTITAAGTAVSAAGTFTNAGTITSTAGTGASINGSWGSSAGNTGTISGALTGVRLFSMLVNSGTISSPGVGVTLGSGGTLDNRAGARVSGGIAPQVQPFFSVTNATVINAGTIDGDVRFDGSSGFSYSNNRYFALPGGVLNGNLTLGSGNTLVTELVNAGTGAIAGITGAVNATDAALVYRVRAAAGITGAAPAGFTSVGYDLYDDAALTLTGAATPLSVAGTGSIDVSGDIAATTRAAIQVGSLTRDPGDTSPTTANRLAITSRGALTLDYTATNMAFAAVSAGDGASFTNAGTITVRNRAGSASGMPYAISGATVVNDGTIMLDGATGIGGGRITNTGTIAQVAGGGASRGLYAWNSGLRLTNTGTIDVGGDAVTAGSGLSVENDGRIASSGGMAIGVENYGTATIINHAGATIAGNGNAIRVSGGTLDNAGTITGDVDLGYSWGGRAFNGATYIARGGTIAGDLRFGNGDDTLVAYDDATGVDGTIDGGEGTDTFVHARTTSGTVTLGGAPAAGFEAEGVRVIGADTVVTLAGTTPAATVFGVSGTGAIVNTATIGGMVMTDNDPWGLGAPAGAPILASFTNQGRLDDGFRGSTSRFVNTADGIVTATTPPNGAVQIAQADAIDFSNAGTIDLGGGEHAALLYSDTNVTAANSGTITGGTVLSVQNRTATIAAQPLAVSLTNTGTITGHGFSTPVELDIIDDAGGTATLTLDNSGTIEATGVSGTAAWIETYGYAATSTPSGGTRQITVTNSGTIRANGGGAEVSYSYPIFNPSTGQVDVETYSYTEIASALSLYADAGNAVTITNTATGTIEATGALSTAISVTGTLDLANAGTIRGGASFTADGFSYAGAIDAGDGDDRIVNTGTIIGSVALGDGNDRVENNGRIEGDVFLGAGDDTFLHHASATLTGTVDAGAGDDGLIIDATGGGIVRASQFVNFERFSQIGAGAVDYVGAFRSTTIGVSGGTVTVAAGETLSSAGATTITGGDADEAVDNAGTIAGTVDLGAGSDRVANAGTIGGAVLLGAGDDTFVERAGSQVAGGVDGGTGTDLYRVALSGDRSGIGARSGFEQLAVSGNGNLTLTLDQDFESVALAGTGLTLTLDRHMVGQVGGSDAAETLAVDGDLARVALGGGDDTLALGATRAAGRYAGGAGSDTLRFTATAPVVLAGTATGFETLALAGGTLTVTGTLGAGGETLAFGAGSQQLTLADGGTLAGTIDLGADADSFRLAPGGTIAGRILGGAGDDSATIVLSGARTLAGDTLNGFETLASEGSGTLTLTGSHGYDRVLAGTDLTVASGATLTTGALRFGAGDQRLAIAGGFAGTVDGGAGSDTIAVSGGSAAAPVAFAAIANVEAFGMTGGFATIAGNAALGNVDLAGGRLVGLAGSAITAGRIAVAQGATFGSAGTVTANLTVAGILSPGASPGTMTVNGNVALAAGSRALFELTPTVSDRLIVNGALSIATGTTLEIVSTGTLRPGSSYDLITASGGISGGFTSVTKPADLFGFVVQRADRIQLLGQFLNDPAFAPQVARSVAYANTTLAVQPASSALFAALPALVDASGASNARAFAQLTPEAYASATQLGVDHALTLSQAARGAAFATTREDAGAFTFAQTVGQWHTLQGDAAQGSAAARAQSYGFLGGLGYGDRAWSVGAFAGYLNGRQQIGAIGARTRADGVVAGVHGRYGAEAGWGFSASLLYDGGQARTDRALPGTRAASARYDLHSWVSDVAAHYGLDVGDGWSLRPRVGVTYVRTTRDGVAENGGSAFALTVARDRHVAGFVDAGIGFARSEASDAPFRPFVALGARYQIEGRRADALAGYAGGGAGLTAVGAGRAELVGTASGGVAYRLPGGLDIFASAAAQTGRDDHQETITAGARLRF